MVSLDERMTQAAFGAIVGISQQAVSDLISRGVLYAGDSAASWLHAYCGHLREQAAGRYSEGDLDLVEERARLAKEQADRLAMQNAETRGELAPVHVIEQVLSLAGTRVAGILDAIPGAVRRRIPSLSAEGVKLIALEVARARNIAAAVSLQDLQPADMLEEPEEPHDGGSTSAQVMSDEEG